MSLTRLWVLWRLRALAYCFMFSSTAVSAFQIVAAQQAFAGWPTIYMSLFPSCTLSTLRTETVLFSSVDSKCLAQQLLHEKHSIYVLKEKMDKLWALCVCVCMGACVFFSVSSSIYKTLPTIVKISAVQWSFLTRWKCSISVFSRTIVTSHMWPLTMGSVVRPRAWIKF